MVLVRIMKMFGALRQKSYGMGCSVGTWMVMLRGMLMVETL